MILVTGGTGRIGSVLIERLLEKGEGVRALVRDGERAIFLPKGAELYYGDITKKETLLNAYKDVSAVVHLAAIVDYRIGEEKMRDVNVEGTRNVLETCPKNIRRFIHCSSISVYGNRLGRTPADEETGTNPSSPYGRTKKEAEDVVLQFSGSVPTTVLRFGVVYGKGFSEGFFPVLGLLEKGKVGILGNGKNKIPFVHVDDVVDAILLAIEKDVPSGNVYNIVGRDELTQKEVFEIACRHLGVKAPKKKTPVFLAKLLVSAMNVAALVGGKKQKILCEHIDVLSSNRVFSTKKAEKELGFRARVPLEDGIKEVVSYYRGG